MIDLEATKARFRETGRKFQTYAVSKGFNASHWNNKMFGKTKFTEAELNALREDGLLVEIQPEEREAA